MANVIAEPVEVLHRLHSLGIKPETLRLAIEAGQAAWNACTDNDPPSFPGLSFHSRAVRTLREQFAPDGWRRNNGSNFCRVVRPDGMLAISVAMGDRNTGSEDHDPKTKSPKGPLMEEAIHKNNRPESNFAFDFYDAVVAKPNDDEGESPHALEEHPLNAACLTYVLLFARIRLAPDKFEVRYELSLPADQGVDGRIERWTERILFPAISVDPIADQSRAPDAPDGEDIDVPVTKKK